MQRRVLLLSLVLLAATASPAGADTPSIGLMVDAGVPDGAQGALIYHPVNWLRLHAGGGYNLVSPGVRAGVSVVRPRGSARPSLVLEAGRYFDGDANPLMRQLTGETDYHQDSLSNVGYDWASVHLGLELGTDRVRFFLHAGFSELRSSVQDSSTLTGDDGARFEQDLRISGHIPSARLGFIVYVN